jgi:hypothetical protein
MPHVGLLLYIKEIQDEKIVVVVAIIGNGLFGGTNSGRMSKKAKVRM